MTTAGIEIADTPPEEADAVANPKADGCWPPTKLQRALYADTFGVQLIEAVRETAERADSIRGFYDVLEEHEVEALGGAYAGLCVDVAKGRSDAAYELIRTTRQLGGQTSHDIRTRFDDLLAADASVFAASEVTPTVAISMAEFADVRRDQREDVLALVRAYARGCRVVLVAGPIERTFLWQKHREQLPASVKEDCNPRLGESASPVAVREQVAEARDALQPDSKPVQILRAIASESSETATYNALAGEMAVNRGTIRNHVTQRLVPNELVDRFDHLNTAHVSLTHIGQAFLDALDSDVGVQSRFEGCVKDAGQAVTDSRDDPRTHTWAPPQAEGGGGSADRHRLADRHVVSTMARWQHAAAANAAPKQGVGLVDHDIGEKEDRGEPHWSYDSDADRLVVGGEYTNPLSFWVCVARALASPLTFRHVLPPERLDGETGGEASEEFADLLHDHRGILRSTRCLGYLSGEATDGEAYISELQDAEEHLCELTRRWKHGEFECSAAEYRGIVTREALGLAGTMVHLLDLCGVDVVREARVPNLPTFDAKDEETLCRTLAVGASIQSRYGQFAAYRQLFEDREEKRERSFSPKVDAADPVGELIGSFVIVGPGVSGLADGLESALERPADLHEDAPEFSVHVPIQAEPRRRDYARTARALCSIKDLSVTRAAVSVLQAFAGSPYDVAAALHSLAPEEKALGRDIRVSECRFALATLSADRIVPEATPSESMLLHTLFTADEPLSPTEIEARGGPSTRSIRRIRNDPDYGFKALDIIQSTEDGRLRLAVAFNTDKERGVTRLPWWASHDDSPDPDTSHIQNVLAGDSPPDELTHPAAQEPQFARLRRANATLRESWYDLRENGWLQRLRALAGVSGEQDPPPTTATFGGATPQASLGGAAMGVAD
ncbi:hypothetical protein [Halococcus saccharolyticus]|uniref:Uncharacterized protein n=1 Tax=Halococcus saccharolyticus DSM 5350 TaxID=1227455 RepID=M0MPJ6_9EURY|nr:hypothetical protein [Halococcus saccharolyticus]EMA47627.1 hypothetical protein C449_01152 [Halococcus saccharolyticus DSM 5350]